MPRGLAKAYPPDGRLVDSIRRYRPALEQPLPGRTLEGKNWGQVRDRRLTTAWVWQCQWRCGLEGGMVTVEYQNVAVPLMIKEASKNP